MSRPAGSKNKKSMSEEERIDAQIKAKQEETLKLTKECGDLEESVKKQKEALQQNRASVKKIQKELDDLRQRKEELAEENARRAQQEKVNNMVDELLAGGKTMDDIIGMLKKETSQDNS